MMKEYNIEFYNELKTSIDALFEKALDSMSNDHFDSKKDFINSLNYIMTTLIENLANDSIKFLKKDRDVPEKEIIKTTEFLKKKSLKYLKIKMKQLIKNPNSYTNGSFIADL